MRIALLSAALWFISLIATPQRDASVPEPTPVPLPKTAPTTPATVHDPIRERLLVSKTYMSYSSARHRFLDMCISLGINHLPRNAPDAEACILHFIIHCEDDDLRPKTLKTYISGIRNYWGIHMGSDPSAASVRIKLLVREFTSSCKLPPLYREAFRIDWVTPFLTGYDPVVPLALSMGFFFFLRVSEYAVTENTGSRLLSRHLLIASKALTLTLTTSKTDTAHRGSTHSRTAIDNPLCPARLYAIYTDGLPPAPADAPALRWRTGAPLTDSDVNRFCKDAATLAGVPKESVALISSHSLRVGGATAAHAAGFKDEWILREGRWESMNSLRPYIRFNHHLTAGMGASMLSASSATPINTRAPL